MRFVWRPLAPVDHAIVASWKCTRMQLHAHHARLSHQLEALGRHGLPLHRIAWKRPIWSGNNTAALVCWNKKKDRNILIEVTDSVDLLLRLVQCHPPSFQLHNDSVHIGCHKPMDAKLFSILLLYRKFGMLLFTVKCHLTAIFALVWEPHKSVRTTPNPVKLCGIACHSAVIRPIKTSWACTTKHWLAIGPNLFKDFE